ncbi:MAG: 3'-phosphoesterase [Thermoplasmata archaeon]|nr:3'-phosphoesterase [Thermoplasmata archaeon]HHH77845.1 3'-phosphoesterase [Thermoplasmatales archaeon]
MGNIFVIQKHYSTHFHYDLRLEMHGTLKSWAIPKGLPEKIGVKRLAMETEDHEMGFATFEGEIPEGTYGAGMIKIWDSGEYEMEENEGNRIVFRLKGKKINGDYCMERTEKGRWLVFRR